MSSRRFELALTLLKPSDWRRFEQFAERVLGAEFEGFRAMASPAGDRGRDGQLHAADDPVVLFQFSVAEDWRAKIKATLARVHDEFPTAKVVVYVTNRRIGAPGAEQVAEARRDLGLFLDIRDEGWILNQVQPGTAAEIAAEELARDIVDPNLGDAAAERHATVLSDLESRAALTYLELRWADDTREKGLTRLAFEGLVRAALRETDSEHRMTHQEVRRRVRALVPTHSAVLVDRFTDAALRRLDRGAVRHWRAADEFCLSYAERERLAEGIARLALEERMLGDEIAARVELLADASDPASVRSDYVQRARRVLDAFLLSRGERFAQSVTSGNMQNLDLAAIRDYVLADLASHPPAATADPFFLQELVKSLLLESGERVHDYLGRLAGSYTLFAFLHETPDVQSAIAKMFAHGEIWLDSSVILPLLADLLVETPHRHFTALIEAARDAGIKLWITEGVIEEVERHLNRTITCFRTPPNAWVGNAPYLYARYVESGRALGLLPKWIESFLGRERPEEDLEIYLKETHGIGKRSLRDAAASADRRLWDSALTEWQRVHHERRGNIPGNDPMLSQILARHDAESYAGILTLRGSQTTSQLGYSSWWLTLDRGAWAVHREVARALNARNLSSPIMSPDFRDSSGSCGSRADAPFRPSLVAGTAA